MGYKNFKPEEVIEILGDLQKYLTEGKEMKYSITELLGALEYSKQTVEMLKITL